MNTGLTDFSFLVATVLIVAGLRRWPKVGNDRRGLQLMAGGLGLALVTVPFTGGMHAWIVVLAALVVGGGTGAFLVSKLRKLDDSQIARILTSIASLALVFAAGAVLHQAGTVYDTAIATRDEAWKNVSRKVQEAQGAAVEIPFTLPPDVTLAAGATAFLGMVSLLIGLILTAKMSDWSGRKSLPAVEAPLVPLAGLAFACLFLAIILFGWPQNESAYWILVILAACTGYVASTMLRRKHASLATNGLMTVTAAATTAAGLVVGNILLVVVGAIVTAIFGSMTKSALDALRAAPKEEPAPAPKPPEIATASAVESST
jgi:NAD/NADP transhydrogenase beta subunit